MEQNKQSRQIDKEFLLTDNSVNSYGFRLLTEGYMQEEFEKNPIGYYMHLRDDGVVVRWTDFRRDGDKVFAKPVINMSNARGGQTYDEVINGFLNAASVGHYVILELSDDDSLKVPGQTGPTVTKWYNRELSLVDIPGNYNALTNLFDKDGNKINALSDLMSSSNRKTIPSKNTTLPQKSYEEKRLDILSNKSWDELDKSGKLEELKKLSEEAYEEKFRDEFGKYPDSRKSRLKDTTPEKGKKENDDYQKKRMESLSAKSWNELDKSGEMAELKQLSETTYRQKFLEHFGVYPTT